MINNNHYDNYKMKYKKTNNKNDAYMVVDQKVICNAFFLIYIMQKKNE